MIGPEAYVAGGMRREGMERMRASKEGRNWSCMSFLVRSPLGLRAKNFVVEMLGGMVGSMRGTRHSRLAFDVMALSEETTFFLREKKEGW